MDKLLLKEVHGLVCPLHYYSPLRIFIPSYGSAVLLLFSAAIAFRAQVEKFYFFITQV